MKMPGKWQIEHLIGPLDMVNQSRTLLRLFGEVLVAWMDYADG